MMAPNREDDGVKRRIKVVLAGPPCRPRSAPRLRVSRAWLRAVPVTEGWRRRRRDAALRKRALLGSLAMHGLLLAALGRVVVERRVGETREQRPLVAVDIGRLMPPPVLRPPPPPLPELPPNEVAPPEPLSRPEPPPIEVVAVQWRADMPAPEPDIEEVLAEMRELAEPPPPPTPPDSTPPAEMAEQPDTSPRWRAVRDAIVRALRYPESARQRGEEGRVWIVLRVRADGAIESLDADGDTPRLVAAAVAAVRRAAPFPGAGPAIYRIPVSFRLVPPDGAHHSPAAGVTSPTGRTWRKT